MLIVKVLFPGIGYEKASVEADGAVFPLDCPPPAKTQMVIDKKLIVKNKAIFVPLSFSIISS
jgi:hypothetical protein